MGTLKKFPNKILKMRFLNSVTVPKNVKGGPFGIFLTSIVFQNVETNEGGTLWCNPKSFKKSSIVPKKKWGHGGSLVWFRGCGRLFCFFFSFWTRFWGSSCWGSKLWRFDVLEQMNKKVDHTRLKNKTGTSKVCAISKTQKAQNYFEKKNEIFDFFSFGKCRIVPKNVKGGTIWALLTYILLQNIKKLERGTLLRH